MASYFAFGLLDRNSGRIIDRSKFLTGNPPLADCSRLQGNLQWLAGDHMKNHENMKGSDSQSGHFRDFSVLNRSAARQQGIISTP